MLESVLESEEDHDARRGGGTGIEKITSDDDAPINGMEAEDRKTVKKRESDLLPVEQELTQTVVAGIRARLTALRKKLQVVHRRASTPLIGSPSKTPSPVPSRTSNPTIATTPPQ